MPDLSLEFLVCFIYYLFSFIIGTFMGFVLFIVYDWNIIFSCFSVKHSSSVKFVERVLVLVKNNGH